MRASAPAAHFLRLGVESCGLPQLVWSGHSCPLPLTLILILTVDSDRLGRGLFLWIAAARVERTLLSAAFDLRILGGAALPALR